MASMWRRLKALVTGARLDRELHDEVRFHLDMEAEKYVRQGVDPDTARAQALRNFGPMTRHVEETRDARGVSWLDDCVQDAALRRAHPVEDARLCRRRHPHPGPGHRRQRGDLQRGQRRAVHAAARTPTASG